MAFTERKYQAFARRLNLTPRQFDELAKRMAGFFGHKIPPRRIKDAFFILRALDAEADAAAREAAAKLDFLNGNPTLKKYGAEILELYSSGFGVRRIAAHLEKMHGRDGKISKSTIDRFIRRNGLAERG